MVAYIAGTFCSPAQINKRCAAAEIERCRGAIVLDSGPP
jgi:hypothetical protein